MKVKKLIAVLSAVTMFITMTISQLQSVSFATDSAIITSEEQDRNIIDSGEFGRTGHSVKWTLDDEGTVIINGEGYTSDFSSAPDIFRNAKKIIIEDGVSYIGNYVFSECHELETVIMADSVKYMGKHVFENCENFKNVVYSENLTYIPEYTFAGCKSLESFEFTGRILEIGDSAFENCGLKNVNLPYTVEEIHDNAFKGNKFEKIILPYNLRTLGSNVFSDCEDLNFVIIQNVIYFRGINLFSGCTSLSEINFTGSEKEWRDIEITESEQETAEYKINYYYSMNDYVSDSGNWEENLNWTVNGERKVVISGTGEMDNSQNFNSYFIKEAVIENGAENIGEKVFYNCNELQEITIPESVKKIQTDAFAGCNELKYIFFDGTTEQWNQIVIENGNDILDKATVFCLKDETEIIKSGSCGENIKWTLDNQCTLVVSGTGKMYDYELGESAFGDLPVKKAIIENGITNIASGTFAGHIELTEITLPETITEIGHSAFLGCDSLTEITIPDSVTTIGFHAFYECRNLAEIDFPENMKRVSFDAFETTKWIAERRKESPFVIANGVLLDATNCKGDVIIPAGVKYISNESFIDCTDITSVVIPEGVTLIGDLAFGGCKNMTEITLPDSLEKIEYNAFSECESLKELSIPENVKTIAGRAFDGCISLTSVNIPKNITTISDRTFHSCKSLTSIVIPEGVTLIESEAFHSCESIKSITLPSTLTEIQEYTFCTFYDHEDYIVDDIYFNGTEEQWNAITIGDGNNSIANATIHYNSEGITEPEIIIAGDINKDNSVDASDASMVLTIYASVSTGDSSMLTPEFVKTADINQDGAVDASDASAILQYYAYVSTGGKESIEDYFDIAI